MTKRAGSIDVWPIDIPGLHAAYARGLDPAGVVDHVFDAIERTRRGENVELFDQIFMGLSLASGMPAVNGTTQRGSQQLRLSTTFRDALANGDFVTVANSLNTFNGTGSGSSGRFACTPRRDG